MTWWQRLFLNTLVFIALSYIVPGFTVGSFWVALGAAIVLGLLNFFIRPILSLLTLPINLITFGLFSVVINAMMLSLTDFFMGASFTFSNFWVSLLVAILMSLINSIISQPQDSYY